MKASVHDLKLDAVAEDSDVFAIEIQNQGLGRVIYINCNGVTIVRIGQIKTDIIQDKNSFNEAVNP